MVCRPYLLAARMATRPGLCTQTSTMLRRDSESPRTCRGLGSCFRRAYGIFFTPVDQNTWCNQRHNVPYVFPETQQADNFTPPASFLATTLNFGTPVLGKGALPATTVSFTAFDPHAPAEYIQQWNARSKRLWADTPLEIGYLGARGFHLQRST